MLHSIAPGLWHVPHQFQVGGTQVSTRMTVVRLSGGKLWLHSPVPVSPQLKEHLDAIGEVGYIVAPNKLHHLFMLDCAAAYPQASLFGAPGLARKRPDIIGLNRLGVLPEPEWREDFDQMIVGGLPGSNECVWYHRPSRTLILTDLCQLWEGPLPFAAAAYARLTGVRNRLAVPYTVRIFTKDRAAMAESARRILEWPFERVVMAHNAILESGAHAAVERAFRVFR